MGTYSQSIALVWCKNLYGPVVSLRMRDQTYFPADINVLRENGYDAEGGQTIRVEVRALIAYTRTLTDNNNQLSVNSAPGFRIEDMNPDILTVMRLYHEHRHTNPCKYFSD